MTIKQIVENPVQEVALWVIQEFHQPIPVKIMSVKDLQNVSERMGILANQYSFLEAILSSMKYIIRDAKNNDSKEYYESLLDKRELIQKACESVKMDHATLSRMVTIYQQIQEELKMSDGSSSYNRNI